MNYTLIITIFVIAVSAISLIFYFFQEKFIFKPEKLSDDFKFKYENQEVEEYNIQLNDKVTINGLHFKTKNPKGVVFYLKGNSKSIKGWGKFAIDFTHYGWDVLMIDYRGFGKSKGKRTQQAMKDDVQAIYNIIKQKVDEKYIIVYGRSLGTGLATKVASVNNPKMLILACPYYSMSNNAKRYLPFIPLGLLMRYSMPTYKWIKYVKCPIKLIHGTNDRIIPMKSSVRLSRINPKLSRLYLVIGGGHKNLHNFEDYHRALKEILQSKEMAAIDRQNTSIDFVRKKRK
ncbi:alpha/beta hydrolase [Aureibaculum sp. 2210JD6-5]|uniref:alpha/beta hydrolase n=1 Tax=Aureibaculum sp. 2210JD6-5 TaxID=3103957 RepID=UPI002AADF11D|nr:alpha/beta hydrolase [Aureibaculum sp. 2210JD6-5]MDY7396462.1 alpha/beta hydrolase [Aureibaculum sp. 2210JD6-5]